MDALSPRIPAPLEAHVTLDAVRELRASPGFPQAMAASMQAAIGLYQGGRLMNWIMSDRARALLGYLAFYLEVAQGGPAASGLTPTRLKQACAEAGLCSPGRAGAMLALMRASGYIALVSDPADRRVRRLVATEKLRDNLRRRLGAQLDVVATLIPDMQGASSLLPRDAFERALVRWMGDQFVGGFRLLTYAQDAALFAEHNAGMMILFNLMLAAPEGSVPPRAPVATSIAGLARRFGVSRTHVLRVLRAAETAGCIARTGEHYDRIVLQPHLAEAVLNLFATIYLYLAHGVRAARAEVGSC